MTPEDPRHATNAGYLAGCRETCCRTAHAAYRRNLRTRQYLTRGNLVIDGTGTRRRLRALMALGWALSDIDAEIGQRRGYCHKLANTERTVLASTARRIAEVYDRLSMRLPDESTLPKRQTASRNRNLARRKGWPPPLALDDDRIDDPDEKPRDWHYTATDRATALRDMAELGVGVTEACRRLHVTRDGLEKWAQRNSMSDVYRVLAAREAMVGNQYTREDVA